MQNNGLRRYYSTRGISTDSKQLVLCLLIKSPTSQVCTKDTLQIHTRIIVQSITYTVDYFDPIKLWSFNRYAAVLFTLSLMWKFTPLRFILQQWEYILVLAYFAPRNSFGGRKKENWGRASLYRESIHQERIYFVPWAKFFLSNIFFPSPWIHN